MCIILRAFFGGHGLREGHTLYGKDCACGGACACDKLYFTAYHDAS